MTVDDGTGAGARRSAGDGCTGDGSLRATGGAGAIVEDDEDVAGAGVGADGGGPGEGCGSTFATACVGAAIVRGDTVGSAFPLAGGDGGFDSRLATGGGSGGGSRFPAVGSGFGSATAGGGSFGSARGAGTRLPALAPGGRTAAAWRDEGLGVALRTGDIFQ